MTAVHLLQKSKYFDPSGREILLGSKLGEGGEGTIYQVLNRPGEAIKLYHKVSSNQKAKIEAMIDLGTERLEGSAAWPKSLVLGSDGRLAGFTLPYLAEFYPIHLLYNPKSRVSTFPKAGVRFLLHTAANIARAFSVVHELGQVIGDVNHANLFVSPLGMVKLIDCDSFQITRTGKVYTCPVGVPSFQPPEWEIGAKRTAAQDNFGLAILLFHLLFLGRHPFAGRGLEERGIEKAIKARDFIYERGRREKKPPGSLPFETYPDELLTLFERAFTTRNPENRPSAKEWGQAIIRAVDKMLECPHHSKHLYASTNKDCHWCRVEHSYGLSFFSVQPVKKQRMTVEEIWEPMKKASSPFPKLPSPREMEVRPSPAVRNFYRKRRKRRNLRVMVAILLTALSLWWSPFLLYGVPLSFFLVLLHIKPRKKLRQLHQIYQLTERDWIEAKQNYLAPKWKEEYRQQKRKLSLLRIEYQELEQLRKKKLHSAKLEIIRTKRENYLKSFVIQDSLSLSSRKIALLGHYGIETASHINPSVLKQIPGLGKKVTERLLLWRKQLVSQFVLQGTISIPTSTRQKIEREIDWKQTVWQRKAMQARDQYLRWIKARRQESQQKLPLMEKKARRLAQAERDYLFLLSQR